MAINVANATAELREKVAAWRSRGERTGLVPTMGALHEGHLALVNHARTLCERVVVSIFVNPRQFAPHEDFQTYPRTFEDDCRKLAGLGVDLVWAPAATTMYSDTFATTISLSGPARGLETDFRPDFFNGVATVCCKLFNQVAPDIAVFGEKDYQQLLVVRQMARDLDLPLDVVAYPTVREPDGLAMSSRNAYLSESERRIASRLYQRMLELGSAIVAGAEVTLAEQSARQQLLDDGFASVDYMAVRDHRTLEPFGEDHLNPSQSAQARILAAARLGTTRLIDNISATAEGPR